jgi:hypothetical protein
MSYSEYTAPEGGGYSEYASPKGDYASPSAKQGTFTELSPYKDLAETPAGGVGDFHVNHFVGYFKPPSKLDPVKATRVLFENFETVFNPNYAKAAFAPYLFQGHKTLKFVLEKPFAEHHEDWISLRLSPSAESFFARTMMKMWYDPRDVLKKLEYLKWLRTTMLLVTAGGPKVELSDAELLLINLRHFLAGRRLWAVGYSPALDLHYVETAACERYSHTLYNALEEIMGFRDSIVDIWVTLIENYSRLTRFKLEVPSSTPQGYTQTDTNVFYRQVQDKSAGVVHQLPWFAEVLARHPDDLTE